MWYFLTYDTSLKTTVPFVNVYSKRISKLGEADFRNQNQNMYGGYCAKQYGKRLIKGFYKNSNSYYHEYYRADCAPAHVLNKMSKEDLKKIKL